MATIDSRIALGVQPTVQLESPANSLAKMLQLQGLQQQNQLGQMTMDKTRREADRQNRLAMLLGGEYKTPEDRESALMRGGFMDEALKYGKDRRENIKTDAEIGKTRADTQSKELETARAKVGFVAQLLGGVKDQGTYDQARAMAQQYGLDVSSMPPQYDPVMIEQKRVQALSMQDQLEQMWKAKDFGFRERQQTETERNNATNNRIAQGQLGVAQGNLGVRRQELEFNRSQPRGQFLQTEQGYVLADPRTGAVQPVMGADGKPLQGKSAIKNLTEGQAKANLFGSRMVEADRILSELEGRYSPFAVNSRMTAEATPVVGGILGAIGNTVISKEGQQAEQAQRDFINAVLRRESGAVIADSEFDNARKQYFPQPGDSPEVLKQKARNRRTAINGMAAEIPGGLRSVPTAANPGGAVSPGGFKILSVE